LDAEKGRILSRLWREKVKIKERQKEEGKEESKE